MVYITKDMVRRCAEHNDGEIFSLEEVSLHQQNIEKIEHIDSWCRNLKILYLHNNLISKIENVGHLKKLEILNMTLNNIEVIENLEGCESLQKLDLTINFVGQLSSVESLKHNIHLRELHLVGNPCSEFEGYRQYVVASLPLLKILDGEEISRSERILASQGLEEVRRCVHQQEHEYMRRRAKEKEAAQTIAATRRPLEKSNATHRESRADINTHCSSQASEEDTRSLFDDEEREFWEKPCNFTPESRVEVYRHLEEKRRVTEKEREVKPKAPRTLITPEGRVLNVNQSQLKFSLTEHEDTFVLDLAVYRHMDTSLLDVDVQPTHARVTIKGKIFQRVLPAEVRPDSSTAKRSLTTGHLVLTMPKATGELKKARAAPPPPKALQNKTPEDNNINNRGRAGHEVLEVDPNRHTAIDLANIVPRQAHTEADLLETPTAQHASFSEGFIDDPDVPPLM